MTAQETSAHISTLFILLSFIDWRDIERLSLECSLTDVVETEEQMLEREQNERDVLDALGEDEWDAGISVEIEDVPAIVNIQTLKGRLIV